MYFLEQVLASTRNVLSLGRFLIPQFISTSHFNLYNPDIMQPLIHSDIGDRRVGLHHDCITYDACIKQRRKELKHIEKAASTLPKMQLFLHLEERRRVRFSVVETFVLEDVPLASQMTEKEKDNLWWCEDDSDMARQCIATICNTTQSRPNCGDSSLSYISVLGRVYDQCHDTKSANSSSPVDENDQKLLSQWARNSHFKRGLEPHIIASIGEQKKASRKTLVYAVQLLHENKMIDVETKAEVIRKCSERISRGARLFAQSLAQADVESLKPRRKVSRRIRYQTFLKFASEYFVEDHVKCASMPKDQSSSGTSDAKRCQSLRQGTLLKITIAPVLASNDLGKLIQ